MKTENKKVVQKGRLHFSTSSYPTFGRGLYSDENPPSTVSNSPYYWWFKYLQLNEDYIATCNANGEGIHADRYKDFGDIRTLDFKTWWNLHAHMFAEPRSNYVMQIANDTSELAPFNSDLVLNLVVPLTWTQRTLKKRFSELVLSKIAKGKRGVSVDTSEAKYQLSGKWHIEALKTAYKIYTLRKEFDDGKEFDSVISATEKRKTKRYELSWADLAIRAKLPHAAHLKEGVKNKQNSDERKIITILTKRYYKRAEQFINAAATTSFPQIKK
jgi:hypothetical protein